MKLTNPETIQESEKDFIDNINAELDWEAIEKLLLDKHNFTLQEEIDYKDGDLIVYKDDIAYKFDFEIKVPLSVIFNREGDCLEISTIREDFEDDDEIVELEEVSSDDQLSETAESEVDSNVETEPDESSDSQISDPVNKDDKVARMASDIAEMISEINQGDE